MSFSEIFKWIGNAATDTGSWLSTAAQDTGKFVGDVAGSGDFKTKNPATGTIDQQAGGFGGWVERASKDNSPFSLKNLAGKNLKFGGVPIERGKGPQADMLKSAQKFRRGPALQQEESLKLPDNWLDYVGKEMEQSVKQKAEHRRWKERQEAERQAKEAEERAEAAEYARFNKPGAPVELEERDMEPEDWFEQYYSAF